MGIGPDSEGAGVIMDHMASIYFATEQWELAAENFKAVIRLLFQYGRSRTDPAVIELSLKTAQCFSHMGQSAMAEDGYSWCVTQARQHMKENSADMEAVALCGMCLEEEAHYYLRQKRFDRAKRPHAEALALAKRVLGPEHEQVAVMLNNMSTILEG